VTRTTQRTGATQLSGATQPATQPSGGTDTGLAGSMAVDADRVFAALADPRRRELLELLGRTPGCSASSLAASLPVSRQAVAQHLAVLEDSRLVSRRRAGREVLFSVRPEGLAATADWLTGRVAAWRDWQENTRQDTEARAALDPDR